MLKAIDAGVLSIAYHETGSHTGWPVILLHGFPYDIAAYDAVAPILAAAGARVIVPFLRGFGPTRFRAATTPRSGEQAALGHDLLSLLDAFNLRTAILAGYDWGGRASCIVAALWPERVRGLVSQNSYNIQNIAESTEPLPPEAEHSLWYQYYFHAERGRLGLNRNRNAICRLLWHLWSPSWAFTETTFNQTALSFDNPDFVEIVIHSYRHRFGLTQGDPALLPIEHRLAAQPAITVPTITLDRETDALLPRRNPPRHAHHFTGPHQHRIIETGGHNLPQEHPTKFATAILDVHAMSAPPR
jgi:pimeloyl-ACP methyl ester carboxylesterase